MENNLQLQQKICAARTPSQQGKQRPIAAGPSRVTRSARGADPPVLPPGRASQEPSPSPPRLGQLQRSGAGLNASVPGRRSANPLAEAGRNAVPSLPQHGHDGGAASPGSPAAAGPVGGFAGVSRGHRTPEHRPPSPRRSSGCPSRRAGARCHHLHPPCAAELAAGPRRGQPPGTPAADRVAHRHFQPRAGSERGTASRGRAGHVPLPGQSPSPRLAVGGQGWRQRLPEGCELNLLWFVRQKRDDSCRCQKRRQHK